MSIMFLPIAVLFCFCENFLLLLGMESEASYYAQIYVYGMIPAMFFFSKYDAIR